MSRFLNAFRVGDAKRRIGGPYGANNPENPENQSRAATAAGFRDCRDFRDSAGRKSAARGADAESDAVDARVALYARLQAEAAAVLAQREPDPIEAAERAAVFGHGGEARAYQPGEPDPLRDGLLRGWRDHRGLVWSPDGPIRDT